MRTVVVGARPPDSYRVPDLGSTRSRINEASVHTAALVIDIVSSGDETFEQLPHYAEFGVDEVIVVDPDSRSVRVFRGTEEVVASEVLGISAAWLAAQLDWPD